MKPDDYAVAISLLADDEPYARTLEAEIRQLVRGDVFLYSRQQEEVARDGVLVELFTRIFDRDAGVAVVLYREGWGKTRYTALEQDALRARRLRDGPRGIVVVSLDGGYPESWYPPDLFRPSPKEFTPAQIAAVVATRAQEAGETIGPEPPIEKAQRLARERAQKETLDHLLATGGPQALETESGRLFERVRELVDQIDGVTDSDMSFEARQRAFAVNHRWGSLVCDWVWPVRNSLDGAMLKFSVRDAPTSLTGHPMREPRKLLAGEAQLALPEEGVWAWQLTSLNPRRRARKTVMLTDEFGDWLIGELLEWTRGARPPQMRRRGVRGSRWLDRDRGS